MGNLPVEFRGVIFDDGWEFDAPCVIYSPIERYGIGGNSGHIESMIEDYCIDLAIGSKPHKKLSAFERKEFRWRGWNMRGMCKRKKAHHVLVTVKWSTDDLGNLQFEMTETKTQYGKQPKQGKRLTPRPPPPPPRPRPTSGNAKWHATNKPPLM